MTLKMKLRSAVIILLVLVAIMLAVGSPILAQDDAVTLTYWRPENENGSSRALYDDEDLLDKWATEHPNIEINLEQSPFESYDSKIITALAAGEAADILMINHVALGSAIGTGGLHILDECVASQALELDDWIQGLDLGVRNEGRYSVPWNTDARVLFYNKKILAEAGIDNPPATWDEFRDAFDAVAGLDSDVYPFAYAGAGSWAILYMWLGNWMVQMDTSLLNSNGDTSLVMTDETKMAFEFAVELAQYSPEASITYFPPDVHNSFAQGKIAFFIQGPWANNTIQDNSDMVLGEDYDVAPIPGYTEAVRGGGALGGYHFAIAENSSHKDEACEFIAWATSPEIMASANVFNIPARVSSIESKIFQDRLTENPIQRLAAAEASKGGIPIPPVPELPEIATIVGDVFNRAVVGDYSTDQALEEMDGRIQELLEMR